MNDSKHRKRSWRWARGWISMFPGFEGRVDGGGWGGVGGDRMVPAIHTSVMCSASEGAETMLVTVGDRDSWLSHQPLPVIHCEVTPRPEKRKGKQGEKTHLWLIKTAGQTPSLSQQQTRATRTPGWHVRQCLLCHSTPLHLLPPSICPSSSLHPPVSGRWGWLAKPSNLYTLSFLPPKIWIWKGTLSSRVKNHHFNDIWQSFDLLGFRRRGEEIH